MKKLLLKMSGLRLNSMPLIFQPSSFSLDLCFSMKRTFRMRAIIVALAFACLALGSAGCARWRGQTTNSSALPDGSTSANANAQVSVPEQADAGGYFNQGKEFLKNNQDREAAESFRRAVEKDKDYAEAYLKLGLAYDALNRDEDADKAYKAAAEAYEKKVREDSKNFQAHFEMGQAYYRLGKYDDAARAFKQATKLEPENGDAQFELGMAHSKQARYDQAVGALKKAVELDPDNYRAVEALEKAEDGRKRLSEMVRHQEATLKKQQEAEKKKAEEENANANASPAPKPSP